VAALIYRYPADRLVCRFKFKRDFASGRALGQELLSAVIASGQQMPDLIAAVPLHGGRHFRRGFNQAELLARQLGRNLDVPVHGRLLSRCRRTRAQAGLDAAARHRNIRGAFRCDHKGVRLIDRAHVALVDDVMTTGATLGECTRALRLAGAGCVSVWVAARAPAT
jgi:ComF family protein